MTSPGNATNDATSSDDDRIIELANRNMTVAELRERVQAVAPNIFYLKEVDGQTVAGARVTLGRISELIGDQKDFAVVVDLSDTPSRPASDYRELMEQWAKSQPPFHAAYVLPPVGAITRMALRFVALRVMKVHDASTSSYHDDGDSAVAHCRSLLASAQQKA